VVGVVQAIVAPVLVMDDVETPIGADNPGVKVMGVADVEPLAFTADTTTLNAVFAGSGGLNVAGDVVEIMLIGGPPFAGYAVIV